MDTPPGKAPNHSHSHACSTRPALPRLSRDAPVHNMSKGGKAILTADFISELTQIPDGRWQPWGLLCRPEEAKLGCLAQSASPIRPRRPPVLGGKAVDVRDFEAAYLVISAEADETMADKHRKTFGRGCTSMFGNAEIQTFVFRIVCYSYPSSDTSECPSMAHDAPVPADENGPRDSQLSISRGITKRRVVSRHNQGGPGVLKKGSHPIPAIAGGR